MTKRPPGRSLLPGLASLVIAAAMIASARPPSVAQDASAIPSPSAGGSADPSPAASGSLVAPATPAPLAMWSPVEPALIPFDYSCGGPSFTAGTIADGPPVDEAILPILSTARSGVPSTDAGTWRVVVDDGERMTVASVIDGRARTASPIYAVELVRSATGWTVERGAACWPEARLDPGVGGYWRLDPTREAPSTDTRRLHLKIWYLGCATDVHLRGRPQVAMTDEAVLIAVPVESRPQGTCRSGTPTRLSVRLAEPLGERDLYDAGKLPLRLVASTRDR